MFKYPSLNSESLRIEKISVDDDWFVTEKIHGSNFQLKMDGAQLKVYSRNCRLSLPGDEADGEQTFPITPKYLPVVEKNRAAMLALGPGLSVFGELFGGAYPGVKSAGKPVQREVMYCGHYEFFVFDVYDHATEKFWDFGKTLEVCTEAGLSVVPVIKRCNFDELAEFLNAPDFERLTSVPARFDLPDLPNNVLEGYVVRPAHEPTEMDFKHGRRAYKARTKAYRETKSMGGGKMAQTMAPDTEVDAWFLDRLTPQRLTNAMSKEMDEELTTKLIAKYIGLLYDDVLKEKDFEGEVDVRRMKTHIGNFLRNELKL